MGVRVIEQSLSRRDAPTSALMRRLSVLTAAAMMAMTATIAGCGDDEPAAPEKATSRGGGDRVRRCDGPSPPGPGVRHRPGCGKRDTALRDTCANRATTSTLPLPRWPDADGSWTRPVSARSGVLPGDAAGFDQSTPPEGIDLAANIRPFPEACTAEGVAEVDLVGHSMGGCTPARPSRVSTTTGAPVKVNSQYIGTPWQGSYHPTSPAGSYRSGDCLATPSETCMKGMRDEVQRLMSGSARGEQDFLMGKNRLERNTRAACWTEFGGAHRRQKFTKPQPGKPGGGPTTSRRITEYAGQGRRRPGAPHPALPPSTTPTASSCVQPGGAGLEDPRSPGIHRCSDSAQRAIQNARTPGRPEPEGCPARVVRRLHPSRARGQTSAARYAAGPLSPAGGVARAASPGCGDSRAPSGVVVECRAHD